MSLGSLFLERAEDGDEKLVVEARKLLLRALEIDPDLAFAAPEDPHVSPESVDPDTGFFLEKLLAHEREGFLWQKLRAPRSYDYKKAENKTYNERYRMPKFPFDDAQREAVMTFVLGLVAEPPAPQFVHRPDAREQARRIACA